jgi:hypothetical protein
VFSQRAVAEVEKVARSPVKRELVEHQRMLAGIIEQYPSGDAWPAFDPWNGQYVSALRQLYERDLAELAGMTGVRLIDLSAAEPS